MTRMLRRMGMVGLVFAVCAGMVSAAEEAQEEGEMFKYGLDIRVRQVHFDEIPIVADPPGVTRSGENHFMRFRTRVWGQADMGIAGFSGCCRCSGKPYQRQRNRSYEQFVS